MNTHLRIYDLKQCELEEFFSEYNDYDNETKLQTINELLETDSKIRIKLLEKYKCINLHLLPFEQKGGMGGEIRQSPHKTKSLDIYFCL